MQYELNIKMYENEKVLFICIENAGRSQMVVARIFNL